MANVSRHLTCYIVLLMLLAVGVRADEKVDAALKRLSTVQTFAFGGVGYAGVISQGETDFKIVLSQHPSIALAAFESLYATGNPQAKAYALAGIRRLDRKRFKELLARSAASDEVRVMRGCIVSHESLKEVASAIDAGKFRF